MENTIFFSLRPELSSDEQNEFLNRVREWNGVVAVGPLNVKADGARKYFVYTRSGARVDTVAARLKRDLRVESASVQPLRYAAAI
jgi:hypothetical protein